MLSTRYFVTPALLLALAACGSAPSDGAASESAAIADGNATESDSGPALAEGWTMPDACAVLSKDAYGAAIDQTVSSTELAMPHPSDGTTAATSECKYVLADGSRYSVMLRWSPINDNSDGAINTTRSGLQQVVEAFGGTLDTVPNLGKAAFWVSKTASLNVFIGEDRMAIINVPDGPAAKDQAIAVAVTLGAPQ